MTYDLRKTTQGQQAEKIQADLRWQLDNIRGDKRLTEEGKRQQIAAVYLQAKKQITGLQNDESQKRTIKVDSLRRVLFGATGASDAQSAISYRDAQERVGALSHADADKAAKLLDQAMLSGDDVMVKAVVQRALDMQWAEVANKYIDKHPHYGQMLEELWGLEQNTDGIDTVGFMNAMVFNISKPSELSHLWDDAQFEALANGA